MLPPKTRYAVRALVELARRAPATMTTEHVAQVAGVPVPSLAKVLQALNHAHLVTTHRGLGGGVSLRVDPKELTVLQIVEAVEPHGVVSCLGEVLGPPGACADGCGPPGKLDERLEAVRLLHERVLRETRLSDLMAQAHPNSEGGCQHPLDALLDRVRTLECRHE